MPDIPNPPEVHELSEPRRWMKYIVVGKLFILPIMVLASGGYFLDQWIGFDVGFSILGLIVGFCLGMWLLVRVEKALVNEELERTGKLPENNDDDDDELSESELE